MPKRTLTICDVLWIVELPPPVTELVSQEEETTRPETEDHTYAITLDMTDDWVLKYVDVRTLDRVGLFPLITLESETLQVAIVYIARQTARRADWGTWAFGTALAGGTSADYAGNLSAFGLAIASAKNMNVLAISGFMQLAHGHPPSASQTERPGVYGEWLQKRLAHPFESTFHLGDHLMSGKPRTKGLPTDCFGCDLHWTTFPDDQRSPDEPRFVDPTDSAFRMELSFSRYNQKTRSSNPFRDPVYNFVAPISSPVDVIAQCQELTRVGVFRIKQWRRAQVALGCVEVKFPNSEAFPGGMIPDWDYKNGLFAPDAYRILTHLPAGDFWLLPAALTRTMIDVDPSSLKETLSAYDAKASSEPTFKDVLKMLRATLQIIRGRTPLSDELIRTLPSPPGSPNPRFMWPKNIFDRAEFRTQMQALERNRQQRRRGRRR
jgi:hypothetical protein